MLRGNSQRLLARALQVLRVPQIAEGAEPLTRQFSSATLQHLSWRDDTSFQSNTRTRVDWPTVQLFGSHGRFYSSLVDSESNQSLPSSSFPDVGSGPPPFLIRTISHNTFILQIITPDTAWYQGNPKNFSNTCTRGPGVTIQRADNSHSRSPRRIGCPECRCR